MILAPESHKAIWLKHPFGSQTGDYRAASPALG
jgi:hypothetical protein